MQTSSQINRLLQIMQKLRDPIDGCPWDLQQDFASIAPYTIEEAYEVADAIERENMDDLRDELGDLLLQTVFHAQLAAEAGAFGFDDVVQAVCDKMVRRHPHVFGNKKTITAAAQTRSWEQQKAKERNEKGATGLLDDIPVALPASQRAVKLQTRAARVGFDWPNLEPVFAKLQEEIEELQEVLRTDKSSIKIEKELGDILFVCMNLSRKLDVNPDAALRQTNRKFVTRFQYIEQALMKLGKTPDTSTLEEMDRLWDEAKQHENE